MSEMPEINDEMIDEQQARIDAVDSEENFVRNEELTGLFIDRVDCIQEVLNDEDIDKETKDYVRTEIYNFLSRLITPAEKGDWRDKEFYRNKTNVKGLGELLSDMEDILFIGNREKSSTGFDKKTTKAWKKDVFKILNRQLKGKLKRGGAINEHYLAILKYPKDKRKIKKIFESLVVYWEDDDRKVYKREDTIKRKSRVYLKDAHPFHLVYIARAIGVSLDFKFKVKGYGKMTLGELIEYEKQNLYVNVPLYKDEKGKEHFASDSEWLLMLLDLEGVSDPEKIVGTNIAGKQVKYSDVLKAVEKEFHGEGETIRYDSGQLIKKPRSYIEHSGGKRKGIKTHFHPDFHENFLDNSPRAIHPSLGTCNSVHAMDALLGSEKAKKNNSKFLEKAYRAIYSDYLRLVKIERSKGSWHHYLPDKLAFVAHAIDFFLHNEENLGPEQNRFFNVLKSELPRIMEEIKSYSYKWDIGTSLAHLYEVLEELGEEDLTV